MKRSKSVPLLVIGTMMAVSACGPSIDGPVMQQSYSTLDDCKKDWDDQYCSPKTYPGTGGYSGGYSGPRYYWNRDRGKPMAVASDGSVSEISNSHVTSEHAFSGRTTTVSAPRSGGFGGMAHGFSGGG